MTKYVKIVYNSLYGDGFCLSRAAVQRARELSGDPKWGGITIKGDVAVDGKVCDTTASYIGYNVPRHDSILVQVVEELGSIGAGGAGANLRIAAIPRGTKYFIHEYDNGREAVKTPDDLEWIDTW